MVHLNCIGPHNPSCVSSDLPPVNTGTMPYGKAIMRQAILNVQFTTCNVDMRYCCDQLQKCGFITAVIVCTRIQSSFAYRTLYLGHDLLLGWHGDVGFALVQKLPCRAILAGVLN